MSMIKLISYEDDTACLLVATSLQELLKKGEKKLGYKISKLLRIEDDCEIDDDETLVYHLNNSNELCLRAKCAESSGFKVSKKDLNNPFLVQADSIVTLKRKCDAEFGMDIERFVRKSDLTEIDNDEVLRLLIKKDKNLWILALEDEKISYNSRNLRDSLIYKDDSKTKFDEELNTLNDSVLTKSNDSDEDEPNEIFEKKKVQKELNESEISDEDDSKEIRKLHERLKKVKSKPEKRTLNCKGQLKTLEIEKKKQDLLKKIEAEEKRNREKEEQLKELKTLSTTLQEQKEKQGELCKQYKEKLLRTEATREASKTEILECEKRIAELDLKQKRIANIFKELEKAEHVDICFMVDATGSMSSYINETKTVIYRIVDKLRKRFDHFNLRAAFVGYRDHSDGADRVSVFQFTEAIDDLKSFVTGVSAEGGADQCEDVFGGLEEIAQLNWENTSRILFHIGDAPCHGKRFHVDCNDSYPDGDPRGLNITNLLQSIVEKNIIYYFAEINNSTIKMIDEFNNELLSLNGNKINVVKLASVDGLSDIVTKAIITTIGRSKSLSIHSMHSTKMKTVKVDKNYLTFSGDKMKTFNAVMYKAGFSGSIDEIEFKAIDLEKRDVSIAIAQKPFDKGAIRFAYTALLNGDRKCVVKQSASLDPEYNTMKFYKDMIESQVVACMLAKKFSELFSSDRSFRFLDVDLIHIVDLGIYYTVENFMEGEFEKWSNNLDLINEDIYSCTLDAFCHWSYQATNEYLIVTDLQGFLVNKKEYILTDPAIQSPVGHDRFSTTNLGKKSVKKYFEKHQCNHICKHLKLKKHKHQNLPDRARNALMTKLK